MPLEIDAKSKSAQVLVKDEFDEIQDANYVEEEINQEDLLNTLSKVLLTGIAK